MGRHYWDKKDTVEDCRSVSTVFLKRYDYFCGLRSGCIVWENGFGEETSSIGIVVSTMDSDSYVRFQYTTTDQNSGEKKEYDYKVGLTTTSCNCGGVRYWFSCPDCGRRVAVLYLAPGDVYFRCRQCNNLSYYSRNESIPVGIFGVTERKIKKLQSEIKRWTWRGRPTRKVRRLQALEQKKMMLSWPIIARMEKFKARIS